MDNKLPADAPGRPDQSAALPLLVSLVLFSWLLLVVVDPGDPRSAWSYVAIGFLLGTVFGQTTLAAAWVALGPFPLFWRAYLSVGWIAGVVLGFAGGVTLKSPSPDEVWITVALCVLGQWLVVQVPLWAMTALWSLRIGHRSQTPLASRLQFGIRQLMIVTTIVAVAFGVGRIVVGNLAGRLNFQSQPSGDFLVFIFLAVASIVMTLPLLLATLVRRFAWLATLSVMLLMAAATAWELPLMHAVGPLNGPDEWHLVWINAFSAAWVLLAMGLLRLAGYGLTAPAR